MASRPDLNKFTRLKTRCAELKADIAFLKNCRRNNVFPNFMKIKCCVSNKVSELVIKSAKKVWLKQELKSKYSLLSKLELELYNLHLNIAKKWEPVIFDKWLVFVEFTNEMSDQHKKIKNQNKKLRDLIAKSDRRKEFIKPKILSDAVVNLSHVQFSEKL